ncbi:serine/threonine protein kinase [Singulisphaera sp. GP187]|uniref:serine/threonine-protein kinase n=1 Tax=Singulisphaera sp. GP187 TaxID=1882752 RepID=UPI00092BF8D5|nr:serine/threonine-protein kinase [Singulisphaera sp. GP187]SIO56161.1 serine/threonine protein kinase [Singulisphaera sp. GP187]
MGRVYLAKDSRLNRRVALKILSPERVNNPRAIARFQREARVGAQLQHENLVRIYDEGESDGKCYLVMEFIAGKTIGSMIAEHGPLPPSTAARLTRQIAMGLEHAHQKGLIHRDVNPYNIMVTTDGTAKLADLGLAIDLAEQVPVTRDGATVGTFDYISPEQARHSHSVDTRSDIYSLGCTLYHMLAGQVPYPSPSLPEKLFGHQAAEPESLTALVPEIPEGLAEVVRMMMRKQPDDRFANPLEVARALEPFVGEPISPSARPGDGPEIPGDGSTFNEATHSSTQVTTARRETLSSSSAEKPPPRPKTPPPDFDALVPDLPPTGDYVTQANFLEGLVDFGGSSKPREPQVPTPTPPPAPAPTPAPAIVEPPPLDFTQIGQERTKGASAKEDLSGLGLALDFGPEPPLSQVAAKSKPKPSTPPSPPKPERETTAIATSSPTSRSAPEAKSPARARNRRLALGAAALLLPIAVAGGLYASGVLGKPSPHTLPPTHPPATAPADDDKSTPVATPTPTGKGPELAKKQGPGIAVKGSDGSVLMADDLKSAMQRAIGSRGHVLLNNREPLRLSGADAAITINGGPLYIRAAEGVQPVLEVEIKGAKPFLTTGVETPLTLVGVTIVAHYSEPGRGEAPPIIQAAGKVTLDRSAFKATGQAVGTRAVKAEGMGLTATGCWFDGFDQALDVAAFNGSLITVRQCIMVNAKAKAGEPPSGWALRVRAKPGGNANEKLGRRLVLDHCTILGKGLFDLVGFSSQLPYKVEVKGSAVLADAVLAWEPQPTGLPPSNEALQWQGQDNLYDIRGKAWITLSPQGTPELAGGPSDLDSWTKQVDESAPLTPPIKFRTDPTTTSESPSPRDFLVLDSERPVGAEPDRVGPRPKPTKP